MLQPDPSLSFVRPTEAKHPMLPEGGGLYTLRTPGRAALLRSLSTEMLIEPVRFAASKVEAAVSNIQPAAGLLNGGALIRDTPQVLACQWSLW